jgi:hypothetical protein
MHPDLEQQALARRLRELPHAVAPPYGWHEFQRRAQRRPPERLARGRALAAATVLVLAVVALATRLGGWSPQSAPPQPPAQPAAPTAAMERWLASLPSEPAVVRVGTRAAVMGLEDRIAQLDDLLTAERLEQAQPERLRALQRERGRLVGTLVQVRYAETLADESR